MNISRQEKQRMKAVNGRLDFLIHIHTIRIRSSIIYFKGSHIRISKLECTYFCPRRFLFILDLYEMLHSAAFHHDLHCL